MKVLLAGATGELGRALAAELLARGHEVRALVRDPNAPRAQALAGLGAELAAGDVIDPAVEDAAAGCGVVIHAATAIGDWERNDRIRREGTRHLLAAAERARASFLLAGVALIYGDGGDEEIEAAEPIIAPAPRLESAVDAELEVFSSGVRFLILRQGILFGPESGSARSLLEAVAAGAMPAAPAWLALLHPDDLARLAVRALERDLNGLYDAVSDTVRLDELVHAAARALDAPEPPAQAEPPNPNLWLVSRRVSPRALAKVGLEPRWTWRQMLEAALEARG
jgi:nucleoside-diphosphate-sugar epimerase